MSRHPQETTEGHQETARKIPPNSKVDFCVPGAGQVGQGGQQQLVDLADGVGKAERNVTLFGGKVLDLEKIE